MIALSYTLVLGLIYIWLHINDVLEAAEAIGVLGTSTLGFIKMTTFHNSMDDFYEFMEKLNKLSIEGF
jgi:hypothetical protein